jgi:hypothetical protein
MRSFVRRIEALKMLMDVNIVKKNRSDPRGLPENAGIPNKNSRSSVHPPGALWLWFFAFIR